MIEQMSALSMYVPLFYATPCAHWVGQKATPFWYLSVLPC